MARGGIERDGEEGETEMEQRRKEREKREGEREGRSRRLKREERHGKERDKYFNRIKYHYICITISHRKLPKMAVHYS